MWLSHSCFAFLSMRSPGRITSNFLTQASKLWLLWDQTTSFRLACVLSYKYDYWDYTSRSLGRHLASSSGEKCHRQVRQGRQDIGGETGKILLTFSFEFPWHLCRGAFAILAMFVFVLCFLWCQRYFYKAAYPIVREKFLYKTSPNRIIVAALFTAACYVSQNHLKLS